MDSILVYTVIGITLGCIILLGVIFLKNSKKAALRSKDGSNEFEDQVLELVSKFQHISATRLNSLEIKMKEVREILKESNEIYLKLTSVMAEAGRERMALEKLLNENSKNEALQYEIKKDKKAEESEIKKIEPKKEEENDESSEGLDLTKSSLEHQILNLSSEGMETDEIARNLGIGRGEVQLVQELFRRKFG